MHGNLKFLCQSRKLDGSGWLVLASMDNLLKENDMLRTSIGDLKSFGCEEKFIKENKNPRLKFPVSDTDKKFKSF